MKRTRSRGKIFFFVIFALLGLATLFLLQPFLGLIALSLVAVVILKPVYNYFLSRKWVRGHRGIATTISIVVFFLVLVIPLIMLGGALINQAQALFESVSSGDVDGSVESLTERINSFIQEFPAFSDVEIDQEQLLQALKSIANGVLSWLADLAGSLGTTITNLIISVFVFIILLGTLLPAFDDLMNYINDLSPLDTDITQLYGRKAMAMIKSMVTGVFLMAIIEGSIMGIFYWLAGMPFVLFWAFLSIMFGVLPIVGISFIVLPMAIILLLMGNTFSAVIVLVGFYVIVNPMDLWLRPRLVSKEAAINFVLILLAIMGGLYLGGLLGLIYGPVIMILFVTTIQIYGDHFAHQGDEDQITETEDESGAESTDEMTAANKGGGEQKYEPGDAVDPAA
jgi:predicted PurR-regulated permease PerM